MSKLLTGQVAEQVRQQLAEQLLQPVRLVYFTQPNPTQRTRRLR